jgi:chromatin remodeling complex protein RSC6
MSSNTSSDNTKMSTAAKSSSKKTAKTEVAVAAPAPVAVAAPAPVAAKAPKTKAEKVVAPVAAAPAPAVAPVAAPAPVAAAAVEEDVSAALTKSIAELHEQFAALKTAVSAAATALKTIEKQAARVVKKAERRKKRKTEAADGAAPKPCIFTKPVKVSDELCAFLGKPKGTEISRAAVTKGVMDYARAHNLMDKQIIKHDASLRKLLTLNEGDNLTILNLQKFLPRHYLKPAPAAN